MIVELLLELEPEIELNLVLADEVGVIPGLANYIGLPGSSAYEVAVENGFVGTVDDFLESLKPQAVDFNAYYIISKT